MFHLARTLRNAALACLICASPAVAEDTALTPLKVGIPYPTTDVLPIYAALAKGYFKDEHLDVETVSLATGDKIAFALVGGSIQIANYTPDWFIRAAEKGADLKIILGEGSDLIFSMIAAGNIKSYADLRGQRVGVSTLKAADAYLVKKMFAAHGLGESDYILIPAGSSPERAAALRAGSLAATLLAPPVDERVIGEGGVTRLDRSSDVVSHYAWGGEAVMEDWAHANKAVLVDYIRAWVHGLEWLRDPKNTQEGVAILAQNLKLPDQFARSTFDLYYGPQATVPPNGKIDLAGYQALLKDMTDQGQIGPPVPPAQKYLDTSYWEEAQKEKSASR